MIDEINMEWEKSDRLTVAKLNTVKQRVSEKHLHFEIELVNTIQPPEIEYTQTPRHWYQLIPHCQLF